MVLNKVRMSVANVSSDSMNESLCANRGVFINFPIEWEIAKWIRCTEFIVTVTLNGVLCVMIQKKGMKSNLVLFLFHLVISDLAVAMFHILPLLINHFIINWSLGITLCKIKFYLSNVSLYASTYLIVTIGIDRLLCVLQPLGVMRRTRRYKLCMVGIPWILSLSVNIPIIMWTSIFSFCGCNICTPDLRGIRQIALLLNATFLLFLPSCVLTFSYSGIALFLYKRLQIQQKNHHAHIGLMGKCRTNSHYAVLSKANRRSTVMTFVVSLTFIVCWLPFILAGLLNLYGNVKFGGWFDIMIALAPLNSMVNPIIFLSFNNRTFISKRKFTVRRADQFELMNIS